MRGNKVVEEGATFFKDKLKTFIASRDVKNVRAVVYIFLHLNMYFSSMACLQTFSAKFSLKYRFLG